MQKIPHLGRVLGSRILLLHRSFMSQVVSASPDKPASASLTLKTPKGMRDYDERETALRNKILQTAADVFKMYGSATIDTPNVELKIWVLTNAPQEILTGKYGEDSKLIYDLADQGGEISSLRYDLTVPLARYAAQHGVKKLKRYQIGKVYRRDNPNISQGRLREFYQCVGQYDAMVPEAECLSVMVAALEKLGIGSFSVKINHRVILDGILSIAGVPDEKIRAISSSIDKLDKKPWAEVRDEIVNVKGIEPESADKIKKYLLVESKPIDEMCQDLLKYPELLEKQAIKDAIHQMSILSDYLMSYSIHEKVVFDLCLARGLDYYTGVIYEAVLTDKNSGPASGLGSVAGGGRYDNLIENFSGNKVCCVGFSIGCERIFSLLMSKLDMTKVRSSSVQVLVAGLGSVDTKEILRICNEIRSSGIATENLMKTGQNVKAYFSHCDKYMIPFVVFVGSKELESNMFNIKYTMKDDDLCRKFPSLSVNRDELPSRLKELMSIIDSCRSQDPLNFYYH